MTITNEKKKRQHYRCLNLINKENIDVLQFFSLIRVFVVIKY